jgi:cell division protein FtsB
MRWLSVALIALIALLQYPLWIGKGGWLRVWDVDRQLQLQKEGNRKLEIRNAGLDAEVRDLKQGYDAIEERARYELGMIKEGEVFVQIPERPADKPAQGLPAEAARSEGTVGWADEPSLASQPVSIPRSSYSSSTWPDTLAETCDSPASIGIGAASDITDFAAMWNLGSGILPPVLTDRCLI